ncbi:hypothetical protein J6590_055007 [Homalodisca vitripennis]|nr:hypothetical protein J6590_055007 [Homalodisca vitripennis]
MVPNAEHGCVRDLEMNETVPDSRQGSVTPRECTVQWCRGCSLRQPSILSPTATTLALNNYLTVPRHPYITFYISLAGSMRSLSQLSAADYLVSTVPPGWVHAITSPLAAFQNLSFFKESLDEYLILAREIWFLSEQFCSENKENLITAFSFLKSLVHDTGNLYKIVTAEERILRQLRGYSRGRTIPSPRNRLGAPLNMSSESEPVVEPLCVNEPISGVGDERRRQFRYIHPPPLS